MALAFRRKRYDEAAKQAKTFLEGKAFKGEATSIAIAVEYLAKSYAATSGPESAQAVYSEFSSRPELAQDGPARVDLLTSQAYFIMAHSAEYFSANSELCDQIAREAISVARRINDKRREANALWLLAEQAGVRASPTPSVSERVAVVSALRNAIKCLPEKEHLEVTWPWRFDIARNALVLSSALAEGDDAASAEFAREAQAMLDSLIEVAKPATLNQEIARMRAEVALRVRPVSIGNGYKGAVALVVDCSFSMREPVPEDRQSRMDVVREALIRLTQQLVSSENVQLGVWLYGHRVNFTTPRKRRVWNIAWGADQSQITPGEDVQSVLDLRAVDEQRKNELLRLLQDRERVQPWGQSPLNLALVEAINDHGRSDVTLPRRLLVIADGGDPQPANSPKGTSKADVLDALRAYDAAHPSTPIQIEFFIIGSPQFAALDDLAADIGARRTLVSGTTLSQQLEAVFSLDAFFGEVSFHGRPAQNVRVTATGPRTVTSTTDSAGRFVFHKLTRGIYRFSFDGGVGSRKIRTERDITVDERGALLQQVQFHLE